MKDFGHRGIEIEERVLTASEGAKKSVGLKRLPVSGRCARECIDIAYGFFTPLKGFMGREDVESVCETMRLADGTLWPIPIILDVKEQLVRQRRTSEGDSLLLTYSGQPLAILEISEIFNFDRTRMSQAVMGTTDIAHPGVRMLHAMEEIFLAGKITLVNPPRFRPPYDKFWYPPRRLRQEIASRRWSRVVAHQTRNVPHTGHEWLMKGAWLSANGELSVENLKTGVLVNCIIGPKRTGDYIDEAILTCHERLREAGYFRDDIHLVSFTLWDMRYAGPREAIFHAIIRKNLGCTHHMFGRDHAGVGSFYDPYDAHRIFDEISEDELGIKPVRVLEWWYCPVCAEVTYSGLCGHISQKQSFSGTLIRSMLQDKVKPTKLIMRPEVYDTLMDSAARYGFGSPFCTEEYLAKRQPVFDLAAFPE